MTPQKNQRDAVDPSSDPARQNFIPQQNQHDAGNGIAYNEQNSASQPHFIYHHSNEVPHERNRDQTHRAGNAHQEDAIHRNEKKGKRGIGRLRNAFFYSMDGIRAAWKDEEAFRQVLVLGVIFAILGFVIGREWSHKILLVLPCFLCVAGELINSAIENAIDFTSTKLHPLAKKAKDMGSALQLVCLGFFLVVWISYLLYLFFKLF